MLSWCPGKAIHTKKKVGTGTAGLVQLPLYYVFPFCRFMDQACGQGTRWVLPFRRSATAPHTQESSNCENANVTFIEQGLRKTKVLVSGLKGLSIDSLSTLLALNGNTTTNGSYSPSHTWISHSERKGWEERGKPGEQPYWHISDRERKVCARTEVLLSEMFPESRGAPFLVECSWHVVPIHCVPSTCYTQQYLAGYAKKKKNKQTEETRIRNFYAAKPQELMIIFNNDFSVP